MKNSMKYLVTALIFFVLTGMQLSAADLTIMYEHRGATAIDWSGLDELNGDGTLAFQNQGDTEKATLRILCNSKNGYNIIFNTSNATGTDTSEMKSGNNSVGYSAKLDTSGIMDATIVTDTLVLNDITVPSLNVNFNGPNDVVPLDNDTQAHSVDLFVALDAFDGDLLPQGTYVDIITTMIALN